MKLLWALLLLFVPSASEAQEMEYGEAEYFLTCAECHGSSGRGDGNLARHLRISPANLTTLSERNDGEFPYWRVFSMIDGRHSAAEGEVRVMPSLGERYSKRDEQRYGPEVGSALTERRIHSLTRYVESLQR